MPLTLRNLFPYLAIALCVAGVGYAVTFSQLEPADFSFNNGTEVKTIDPAKSEGVPDGRIIDAIFEGLLRMEPMDLPPDKDNVIPLEPKPGVAESYTTSNDNKTYTFKLRDDAFWTDGTPVTAQDFVFSWQRYMHPDTATTYGFQLHYLVGAKEYNLGILKEGDHVEVELYDRPGILSNPRGDAEPNDVNQYQPFPRGTVLRGVLTKVVKPIEPVFSKSTTDKEKEKAKAEWKAKWVYLVSLKPEKNGKVDWEAKGKLQAYSKNPEASEQAKIYNGEITRCHHVLIDWASEVGVRAEDDKTLVVTLKNPTPYFDELVAFYTLYPVNRKCVETWGSPEWTKPEHIVGNGPYTLVFRRIRDRIRLRKNPKYWKAETVKLNIIDAYTVISETTDLNMFMDGLIDWGTTVPQAVIPDLFERDKRLVAEGKRPEFQPAPGLIIYFYRLNTTRKPFNDKMLVSWTENGKTVQIEKSILVRQALNMAIDKAKICREVTKAGERPAVHFVPPGLKGYHSPKGGAFDVDGAKRRLTAAGYPGGKGFPSLQILYNTQDAHRAIAEVIQQEWRNNLNIRATLKNSEWGVYLSRTNQMDYDVVRSGWVPDYSDPNTFLDMWVTDGGKNNTGWSNKEYDKLIKSAAEEPDPQKRLRMFEKAEGILLYESPIIPIYFYATKNTVSNRVRGFHNNPEDQHPIHLLDVVDQP